MKAIFWEGNIEDNYIGHIMAEIWRDKVYEPFLMGKKDLTILDIGSNIGITALYFSDFGTVYAIEPSTEHFQILTAMIAHNGLQDKIKPFKKALYIKSGKLPLFKNPNRTMYSLHQSVADPKLGQEMVDCITIDQFMTDNKIDHVDFMKLDIEGSEVEVFSHSSFRKVASKIDTIVFELHDWSGRHPNQVLEALKSNNYQVHPIKTDANMMVAKR